MSSFIYPNQDRIPFTVTGGTVKLQLSQFELTKVVQSEIREIQTDPVHQLVRKMFKTDLRKPLLLTPAELEIFNCIYKRAHKRVVIISSTQYGKTLVAACALLLRISSHAEEWLVTVPDKKRGKLLMNYIISATADHPYFKQKLVGIRNKDRDALNRLMEERSKVKLTYQVIDENDELRYGSIEIVSCEAHLVNESINAVMGFGGRNVLSDESSLVSDEIEAGIFRMLAGKGKDTCYIKIGNPFKRNHFYTSFKNPKYKKIYIDEYIGLADGQYNQEFLTEAITRPMYSVLFQCRFPEESAVDSEGYSTLITESELQTAITSSIQILGELRLGVDVAGDGSDFSTIVLRCAMGIKVLFRERTANTMLLFQKIIQYIQQYSIVPQNVFIDKVGVGKGVYDRLVEEYKNITGVNGGHSPERCKHWEDYFNRRAQMWWRFYKYLLSGAKLENHSAWEECLVMKYRKASGGRTLQIMPKKEMRRKRIKSPDVGDAAINTFYRESVAKLKASDEELTHQQRMFNKHRKRRLFYSAVKY